MLSHNPTESRLTPNGGGAGGDPPGSALESTATRLPRVSIAAILLLFALATPAAGQIATGGVMRFATDEVAFIGGLTVRVSIRFGTSTAVSGPAVEPDIHPTIGAGVRLGGRFGVMAEVDRARAFTLTRGGLFVSW